LITSRNRKLRVFLLFILCSFIAAHLCFRLLPNVFETGNAQAVDQLYVLRASIQTFRPAYDPTVAYVDLNNTSIQRLKNLYLNRGHYARLITKATWSLITSAPGAGPDSKMPPGVIRLNFTWVPEEVKQLFAKII
jgi:hypothetical protein